MKDFLLLYKSAIEKYANYEDVSEIRNELAQVYTSMSDKAKRKLVKEICYGMAATTMEQIANAITLYRMCDSVEVCEELYKIVSQADVFIKMAVLYNLYAYGDIYSYWEIKKKIYRQCYIGLSELLEISKYQYRKTEQRNAKRIVIIAEDVQYLSHAEFIFQYYDILQNILGYEVVIVCMPITVEKEVMKKYLLDIPVRYEQIQGMKKISYKGRQYNYIQTDLAADNMDKVKQVIASIYEWNPLCILSIGTVSPVADILQQFIDVAAGSFFSGFPISDARVLIHNNEVSESHTRAQCMEAIAGGQQVYFMKRCCLIEKEVHQYTQKELGLPEEKFLIGIIGTRLDDELNQEEIEKLVRIAKLNDRIEFVIIGNMNELIDESKYFSLRGKIHYLGQQDDLTGVCHVLQLYYNPKRLGGGLSALYALYAGAPVVTLSECDVAGNVGAEFTYDDFESMLTDIGRYINDQEYYKKKQEAGMALTNKLQGIVANELKELISELVYRINGKKVYLLPITSLYTEDIIRWRNAPEVRQYFIYRKPFTTEEHERWMEKEVKTEKCKQFIIYYKKTGSPIGSVYLRDIDRVNGKAEYGIFIGDASLRGKGLGTEVAKLMLQYAFERLKLHKVMLRVLSFNIAAVKSYEKAGFVQEAYLREEVLIDSEYQDVIYMAAINPDKG